MERCRISGLQGDKIMATPIINLVGEETWKIKEAKATLEEEPFWGAALPRTINWKIATSLGYLQAGADILVLTHSESIKKVKEIIRKT